MTTPTPTQQAEALWIRAHEHVRRGEFAPAVRSLAACFKILQQLGDPRLPEVHRRWTEVHALALEDVAHQKAAAAKTTSASQTTTLEAEAEAAANSGDLERAIALLERALSERPDNELVRERLSELKNARSRARELGATVKTDDDAAAAEAARRAAADEEVARRAADEEAARRAAEEEAARRAEEEEAARRAAEEARLADEARRLEEERAEAARMAAIADAARVADLEATHLAAAEAARLAAIADAAIASAAPAHLDDSEAAQLAAIADDAIDVDLASGPVAVAPGPDIHSATTLVPAFPQAEVDVGSGLVIANDDGAPSLELETERRPVEVGGPTGGEIVERDLPPGPGIELELDHSAQGATIGVAPLMAADDAPIGMPSLDVQIDMGDMVSAAVADNLPVAADDLVLVGDDGLVEEAASQASGLITAERDHDALPEDPLALLQTLLTRIQANRRAA